MSSALKEEHELGNLSKKPIESRLDSRSAATDHGVLERDQRGELTTIGAAYTSTIVTAEERKVQKKAELKGFCTLLLFIFLEGWNDGTLGL